MKLQEGYMPFLDYRTYYRIVGESRGGKAPLLLLHGGPGSTHNYFEVLDCLADEDRAIISYDQLGCGNSFIEGHPELWTARTWLDELAALRAHLGLERVHLLGQSWGGMMIIAYLCDDKPTGVASAIISSGHPSSSLWASEQHRMIRRMSEREQAAIARAEASGDFREPEYLAANEHFMELNCCDSHYGEDAPECLRREKKHGDESYLYGWGPNEYVPSGSLKDFEYIERLPEIDTPTLIVSGTDDLCTPLVAKTMADGIPGSRWELFQGCRHMCFAEDTERYCKMLSAWLAEHD
ncbi:MAG: alpha/beta fold hydrolase [Ruminococcaceae bacterium]|jgi:proline iminopeptidase|nr:alpha/beta fold hydrolase [Oscillospiraceae bacterium]